MEVGVSGLSPEVETSWMNTLRKNAVEMNRREHCCVKEYSNTIFHLHT